MYESYLNRNYWGKIVRSPTRAAATGIQRSIFWAKSWPDWCSCGLGGKEGWKHEFATASIFWRRRRRCRLCEGPSEVALQLLRWSYLRNGGFSSLKQPTTPHKIAGPASVTWNMPCPGGQTCVSRPVEKNKCTVPSRREKLCAPSRHVERKNMYRPVPSWQVLFTVASRHEKKVYCTVPPRPVEKFHTHRPFPSHPRTIIVIILSSRPVFNFFPAKRVKTVPSRPVSNITSHEKPWCFSRISVELWLMLLNY